MSLLTSNYAASLTDAEAVEYAKAILAVQHAEKFGKFEALYPSTGPLRRQLYPRHMEFFEAGKTFRERCAMCANRIGKTYGMGGYEFVCHITGRYPDWWPGKRFHRPINAWAAGDTNETTRDILQKTLLGAVAWPGQYKAVDGSGLIPRDCIDMESFTWRTGVSDLVDTFEVQHVTGGKSLIGLKSYMQGRKAFQGTEQDLIWADEEPPQDVYVEMLMRTMTTNGITMLTYTPLEGLTETVLSFLPDEMRPASD